MMRNLDEILKLVQSGGLELAEAKRLLTEQWFYDQAAEHEPPFHKEYGKSKTSVHSNPSFVPSADDNALCVDDTLGFAQLDLSREARTGFPEVIYGESKSAEQIAAIFTRIMARADRALATRVSEEKAAAILPQVPGAVYHAEAKALTWRRQDEGQTGAADGYIAVVCAGTSDIPVAEEAAVTAECLGCRVERVYDVGVAGIQRLFRRLAVIRGASAVVVAAGMEGALASVVGGLVAAPVIAVPTSVGYGTSFQGVAALLAMLNACAPGVSVVNIDNGFGAGYNAALIHKNRLKRDER